MSGSVIPCTQRQPNSNGEDRPPLGRLHGPAASYRAAGVVLVAIGIVAAILLELRSKVDLEADGAAPIAWVIAALLSASRMWWTGRGHTRVADACGVLGLVWLAGLSGGALAMLGLTLHLPLADTYLLSLDRALGLDGLAITSALIAQGQWLFSIMAAAYAYTIPLLVLSMVSLALAGCRLEVWRAAFCFIGSLFSICFIAMLMPAKGLGVWAPPDLLARVPDHAMRYFWANFDKFYNGRNAVLGLSTLDGVISFPSFHAVMGFITVTLWRKNICALALSSCWLAFMLLATLPYGGHYVVDLIGALLVWAVWFAASCHLETAGAGRTAATARKHAFHPSRNARLLPSLFQTCGRARRCGVFDELPAPADHQMERGLARQKLPAPSDCPQWRRTLAGGQRQELFDL